MAAWVILFRGVGGATQLPVAPLRAGLADAGFGHVATYVNSGNAVLTSPLPREEVAEAVARLCLDRWGFRKEVHVLSHADWAAVEDANPFPEAVAAPTTLHAASLLAPPDPARVAALRALATGGEGIEVRGLVAWLHTPGGFGRSVLAERFDRGLGVPNTARNWNTVRRLRLMADAAAMAEGA